MYYKVNYAVELPLWVEIAAWILIAGLTILLIYSIVKKARYRKFMIEGKVAQMFDMEDNRGKMVYEIFITRSNGDLQKYLTDKKIYQSIKKGDLIHATICNERIIRVETMRDTN